MKIDEYITDLRKRKNIIVTINNDELKIKGNRKDLTTDIVEDIKERKAEILQFFNSLNTDNNIFSIPKAGSKEYYSLSSAQKRIYFLYAFDRDSTAYNIPQAVRLTGNLDIERIQNSINKLIVRHESLRTSFEETKEGLRQKVLDEINIDVEYFQSNEAEAPAIIQKFTRPFDLCAFPLMRVGVISTAHEAHILIIDIHHIITDGESQNVLLRDFMSLYNNEELPVLALQYKDYAEWQQGEQQRQKIAKQKLFWLNEFSKTNVTLELPVDFSRPAIKDYKGNVIDFEIDRDKVNSLKRIAEKEECTLFMIILSIYNILLSKLSNQEDIVVGTPISGREHADLEGMIGIFINTLPLRNYPAGQLSFIEFLSDLRSRTLSCLNNQAYQYEELIDELKVERDTSRNPLFDTMFIFQNFQGFGLKMPGLSITPYDHLQAISKFDITLRAIETADRISFNFEYSTALFKEETIRRFITYFRKIVADVTSNADVKLADIEIISPEEKHQLVHVFNNTHVDYHGPNRIERLFEETVRVKGESAAVVFEGQTLTYRALNERSNQLARKILGMGVKPEDRIGLLLPRSFELVISMIGVLKSGCAYVPLDPEYPSERIKYIMEDSDLRVLLTEPSLATVCHDAGAGIRTIDVTSGSLLEESAEDLAYDFPGSGLAYLIYTSGSTGKPKGVMIEHRNVVNFIQGARERIDFHSGRKILSLTTVSFDIFVLETFVPLVAGMPLVLGSGSDQKDPESISMLIGAHGIDMLQLTPSHLRLLLSCEESANIFSRLSILMVGGEPFGEDLLSALRNKYQGKIYNMFGPTETTVWSTIKDLTGSGSVTIGTPLMNTTIRILGSGNSLQPIGVCGELCIGGSGVGRGYWKNALLSGEKFIADPVTGDGILYRTGDLGRWVEGGELEHMGRSDDQLKLRGFRIEPGEIERSLLEHEEIKEALVLKRELGGYSYLVAYYVSPSVPGSLALREFLLGLLPEYMVPSYYVRMESFPLTPNGKLDRKRLPLPEVESEGYIAPRSPEEHLVWEIWREVLGTDAPGIRDNFFSVGGDSIKSIQISSRLRSAGYSVTVKEIFRSLTIESLALKLSAVSPSPEEKSPKPFRDQSSLMVSDLTYGGLTSEQLEELKQRYTIEDIYPLSPMQEGMLFHSLMDVGPDRYFKQITYRWNGRLDVVAIEKSMNDLISRYDVLRTVFLHNICERPLQLVLKERKIDFTYKNIQKECLSESREAIIRGYQKGEASKKFDLSKDVLMRLSILQVADDEFVFIWSHHHILMDGWCISILIKEFGDIYSKNIDEREIFLPPAIPYSRYIKWIESKDKQESANYWTDYLRGYEQLATLAQKQSSTEKPGYREASQQIIINNDRTKLLTRICGEHSVTINTILQVAWGILLSRYNNVNDVVFGSVISGRPAEMEGIEQMVGLFINTVPVRVTVRDEYSIGDLLREVQNNALESEKHHYHPLSETQRLSGLGGRLLDHVVVFENYPVADEIKGQGHEPKDYSIDGVETYEGTNYDLLLTIYQKKEIYIKIVYNTEAYDKTLIEQASVHLDNIITQICDNGGVRISDMEITTPEERHRLLNDLNNTGTKYPEDKTIIDLFDEQVKRAPDSIAVKFKNHCITYRELDKQSDQLAVLLRDHCAKGNHPVGLLVDRSIDTIIGMLAILKAGAAYLPIDPDYPEERIKYIIEDSGIDVLLTTKDITFESEARISVLFIEDLAKINNSSLEMSRVAKPADLCYIIYTSGTTGNPKGVMVEHRNVVRLFFNDDFQFEFGPADVWTMFHSHCFDFSVWEIYGALLFGGTLIIIPKITAINTQAYLDILKDEKVTVLNQTPSAFYNLMHLELLNSDTKLKLKYVIFGGEALSPGKLTRWQSRYPNVKLINMFGITETTVHVTYKEIGLYEIENNISNVGKPIPTLSVYILDAHQKLAPRGVVGELYVGGAGVSRGYLGKKDLTAKKFILNPYNTAERLYRSGDLARILGSGDLEYLGRIDHQVQLRGFRIELGEIETQLSGFDTIHETAVLLQETEDDKYLVAYYVSETEIESAELRAYLSGRLPDYMVPSYYVHLTGLPLTANGKLDKSALPHPAFKTGRDHVAPGTKEEILLAEVWCKVLNLESIGVTDNFFTAGGDSIRAIRLLTAIKEKLGKELALIDLFENPTIAGLVNFIDKKERNGAPDPDIDRITQEIAELKQKLLPLLDDNGNVVDIFPMSDIEKGMVYHSISQAEDALYHDQNTYCIRYNEFDLDTFRKALTLMVGKHSILRTGFNIDQFDVPLHIVYKEVPVDIAYEDLSMSTRRVQESFIRSFMEIDRQNPFDYKTPPLWRMKIYKVSPMDYFMIWICHHSIMDGWSVASFVTELSNTYLKSKANANFRLLPLKIDYKDYVIRELKAKRDAATQDYWRGALSGVSKLEFKDPDHKDTGSGYGIGVVQKKFPGDFYAKISAHSGACNVGVREICFSAFLVTLKILTYGDEFVTGFVSSNRPPREDGDRLLGCFLNTIPFRFNIQDRITWFDYLGLVNNRISEMRKFQQLTLAEILNLADSHGSAGNGLFNTIFNYVDFHIYKDVMYDNADGSKQSAFYDLDVEPFTVSNTDLDFTVNASGEILRIAVNYSKRKFRKEYVNRFLDYYERIVYEMIERPRGRLSGNAIVSIEEKHQLVHAFNNTRVDYHGSNRIERLFEETARAKGESAAIVFEGKTLSYKALNERSNQLARKILCMGVKPEDRIGLLLPRSFELLVSMLGVLKSGCAYVPLDPEYPAERIKYIVEDSGLRVLLTEPSLMPVYGGSDTGVKMIDVTSGSLLQESTEDLPYDFPGSGLAYLIYTSGSTGKPKGVMIEHRNVVNFIHGVRDRIDFSSARRILSLTTVSFDIFVLETFVPLVTGMPLVLASASDQKDPASISVLINAHGIDMLQLTPSHLRLLLSCGECDSIFSRLSILMVGGESFAEDLLTTLRSKYAGKVYNMFGPTETTVWSTIKDLTNSGAVTIGTPLMNTTIRILGSGNSLQPAGVCGELCIGGSGVGRGYWNNALLSAEKFIPDPITGEGMLYRTGDLGRWVEGGEIEFIGRSDDQVKIRGFRIEPGEIERSLLQHEEISEAVVVKRELGGDSCLVAYYVSSLTIIPEALRDFLLGLLPEYMVPSHYVRMESFPLTPNGKLDRKRLPLPEVQSETGYVAPRSPEEHLVSEIWREVLGLEAPGIRDNFFSAGGDSIKSIQISSRLRSAGYSVTMKEIFRSLTIESLALKLQATERSSVERKSAVQYRDRVSLTPADLTYRALTMDQLEELRRQYDIEDIYPLSPMQEGMLFHSLMDPDSEYYFQQMTFRLKGDLDIIAMERSLDDLAFRYDVLRTALQHKGYGRPLQVIVKKRKITFAYKDIREDCISGTKEDVIRFYELKDKSQKFDLSKDDDLVRLSVFQIAGDEFVFIWSYHHILMDRWCMGIIINDFRKIYAGNKNGKMPALPPVDQYSSYIDWLEKRDKDESISYWKDYLASYESLASLPKKEFSNPGRRQYDQRSKYILIGKQETKLLHKISRELGVSLNTILQSAWGILLAKYNNVNDIVFGSVVSGRPTAMSGAENMVGLFINTIPTRVRYEDEHTIKDLLQQVQEASLESEPHSYVSLSEIQSLSELGRGLLDHIVTFENPGLHGTENDGAAAQEFLAIVRNQEMDQLNYDLWIYDLWMIISGSEELQIKLGYNSHVYEEEIIKRASVHLHRIISCIIHNSGARIADIEIVAGLEKQDILYAFNNTLAPYSSQKLMHQLFEEQVEKSPDKTAIISEGISYSYHWLNVVSNQLAGYLRDQGIKRESAIIVMMDRKIELVVALFAILKSGGKYVPVEPDLPDARKISIIGSVHAECIITNKIYGSHTTTLTGKIDSIENIICLDKDEEDLMIQSLDKGQFNKISMADYSDLNPERMNSSDDLAYVIFTSGSTGQPKGVAVQHKPAINLIEWVNRTYGIGEDDKIFLVSSISFDLSVYDIFGGLAAGASVRIANERELEDPEGLAQIMIGEKITFWNSAPAMLQQVIPFLENRKEEIPAKAKLRLSFSSGDWVPLIMPTQMKSLFGNYRFIALGGATEATVWSNYFEVDSVAPDWKSIPYGKPIQNAKYLILDKNRKLCPVGIPGDLYIGGQCLAKGYFNDRELSDRKFIKSPFYEDEMLYSTGDTARWFPDGNMEFLGRKDAQVKIRGYRIELGEIESRLLKFKGIDQALAHIIARSKYDKFICAYYTSKEILSEELLKEFLSKDMPSYMLPQYFVRLDTIPTTKNGKVNRKALPSPTISQITPGEHQTNVEKQLVQIWAALLGIETGKIGTRSDFFDLGGHSILAVHLINVIQQKFSVSIKLRAVFDNSTLQKLAALIKRSSLRNLEIIPPAEKRKYYPASSAQERLFFQQMLDVNSLTSNISTAYEITGELDLNKLKQSFQVLINRHEGLRTRFSLSEDRIVQLIEERVNFELEILEIDQSQAVEDVYVNFVRPFDLHKCPLMRCGLLRHGHNKLLFVDIHHIVCDGISLNILMNDFKNLYEGNELAALDSKYVDYACLQKKQKKVLEGHRDFWVSQLSGELPGIDLPVIGDRDSVDIHPASKKVMEINGEVYQQLKKFSTASNVSDFMFLISIYYILLSRMSGNSDIIIGTDAVGRTHSALRNVVGTFVNILPLRLQVNNDYLYQEFLAQVKSCVLAAFDHQEFQYDEMVPLVSANGKDKKKIAEVHFSFANYLNSEAALTRTKITPVRMAKDLTTQYEFKLEVSEENDKMNIAFIYSTALYDDATINLFMDYYRHILMAILHNSSIKIRDIQMKESLQSTF